MCAQLTELQSKDNLNKLSVMGDTRWGSIEKSARSNHASIYALLHIVAQPDFLQVANANKTQRQNIKDIIQRVDLTTNIVKIEEMCKPINDLITKFQSDKRPVFECYDSFCNLIEWFETPANTSTLMANEGEYIVKCIKKRWEFIYSECHGIAYLLDIRFLGEKLGHAKGHYVLKCYVNFH